MLSRFFSSFQVRLQRIISSFLHKHRQLLQLLTMLILFKHLRPLLFLDKFFAQRKGIFSHSTVQDAAFITCTLRIYFPLRATQFRYISLLLR